MKCCASPTISTAADAGAPTPRGIVQALIFSEILKPLTAALGPAGAAAVPAVTQQLLARMSR